MLDHRLCDSELAALRLAHSEIRDQRKADRLKAVYLLGKGWSAVQVSEALLVDDDTVRNWFQRYQEQGLEGLIKWLMGGSQGYLSTEQLELLRLHLEDNLHSTSHSVRNYLQKHTQVCYKPRGLTGLLNRLGFRFKKAKLVPGKADAEKQEAFLEQLSQIKQGMKPADDLYYMDAMHPQHNTQAGYGWIKRGATFYRSLMV